MARRRRRCSLKRHSSAIGSTEPDNVTNPLNTYYRMICWGAVSFQAARDTEWKLQILLMPGSASGGMFTG